MLKNKRTRVLLYVLGAVLVVAIGVGIWGVATGKIKSLADIKIMPPSTFDIEGVVSSTQGLASTPLPRVTIELRQYDPSTKTYTTITEVSDDIKGNYSFKGVATGYNYRLYAYENPGCHQPVLIPTFSGKVGEQKRLDINLRKYPTISGSLKYKDGTPVVTDVPGKAAVPTTTIEYHVYTKSGQLISKSTGVNVYTNTSNYFIECNDPNTVVKILISTQPLGYPSKLIKTYAPVPWAGATLNITLPYNRSDRPI